MCEYTIVHFLAESNLPQSSVPGLQVGSLAGRLND